MWQYNYTGVDNNSDELTHWKYIKRYKRNGKWRYVYANAKTHDKIDSKVTKAEGYRSLANDALAAYTNAWDFNNSIKNPHDEDYNNENKLLTTAKVHSMSSKLYGDSADKLLAKNEYSFGKTEISELKSAGRAISKKINKGKKAVSKLLKKLLK